MEPKTQLLLRLKRFQLRQQRERHKTKADKASSSAAASKGKKRVKGGGGAAQWRLIAQNSIDHFGLAPPAGNKHGKLIVNAFATHASKVPQKCDHLPPPSFIPPSLSPLLSLHFMSAKSKTQIPKTNWHSMRSISLRPRPIWELAMPTKANVARITHTQHVTPAK